MIMAQNPLEDLKHQQRCPTIDECDSQIQPSNHQQLERRSLASSETNHNFSENTNHNNRQPFQLERDGKRNLIKNQLHLIEQLQLENANLRNERDQLQLENEELKFQLQMISSSNILSQTAPTFNSPQLGRLVENDAKIKVGHCKGLANLEAFRSTSTTVSIDQNNSLATPLRQPVKTITENHILPPLSNSKAKQLVRSYDASSIDRYQEANSNHPYQLHSASESHNKKPFNSKSSSLSAITKNSSVILSKNENLTPEDEDELVRLVEEKYGGDSKKIQAAAIIIQRTFRKHQICKRFRTITEQLRHTHQSSVIQSERKHLSTLLKSDEVSHDPNLKRLVICESLSHTASCLSATTTAKASNVLKQPATNGLMKQQVSGQQQIALQVPQFKLQSSHPKDNLDSKQDSVVAAAINFQQLESIRKRQYRLGLNIFNKSPEKGVSFLVAHSFIDSSSPYTKASAGFYHSNQLHFIDKQSLIQPYPSPMTNDKLCHICIEEDHLKKNIAHFLLHRKGLAKEKIGQYLGNLQEPFNQGVLIYYLQELDFYGLQIDLALRKFLATFRLPGEAQKIEKIVDSFAHRYVQCQQSQQPVGCSAGSDQVRKIPLQSIHLATPQRRDSTNLSQSLQQQQNSSNYKNNLILLSKDEIFILTFAIIMLNTDLHSPSLKPASRMSAIQFVNNLRGVFKSQSINENDLVDIYERVKANQITTTPDHVTHVMKVQQSLTVTNFQRKEIPNLCVSHRRLVCFCRLFEVYDVNKKERPGQHQREIFLFNDILLVTKLARRVRANSTQLYTYRQNISLQGLYVQLFQTAHYNFGIRLCHRINDETLIMFNARNELDQSRFVDDLQESIAEMEEMEMIKAHDVIETIHFNHLKRLRRHAFMHSTIENTQPTTQPSDVNEVDEVKGTCDTINNSKQSFEIMASTATSRSPLLGQIHPKFSSMSNLSSVDTGKIDISSSDNWLIFDKRLKLNNSSVQPSENGRPNSGVGGSGSSSGLGGYNHHHASSSGAHRRCSTSSVHSLDSGLFLSRDVSPNQSS